MLLILLAITAPYANAQNYPTHPIRLIVPFSPGSSANDILGRGIAARLTVALGRQVVVDNRPGAGGSPHLCGELFKTVAGVSIRIIFAAGQ